MANEQVNSVNAAGKKPRPSWGIYIAAMLIAGLIAGFISLFLLADSLAALGIPDPGRITTFGLPLFRGMAWVLMALSVGSFLASSFLIAPRGDNATLIDAPLSVDGHIAARTGTWASFGVAAVGLVEIPLIMSDLTGAPFSQVFTPSIMKMALTEISTTIVWAISVVIALVVGILGLVGRGWSMQPVLLFLSIMQVVPIGMEGHSAAGGDHDYGTNSLLWHLVFVMLWVGGLMALIAHGRRLGPNLAFAVKRYSGIAFMAIVVLAVSGLINTLIRMNISDLVDSAYGIILITKFVLTILLGIFGLA
ncbi:copper resistance D family protein, partial [Corynebacterium parakroppenstedtii]